MKKNEIKHYLEKGTEIAGGAVGSAIGLMGGPVGAILGGALGAAFVVGIKEFIHRQMSNRQEMRVAASTAYILTGVNSKLNNGAKIRKDAYFEHDQGRSSAEELFEGILIKCKDEYQEKKIVYISKIFENVIFDESLDAETINYVLSSAENFSYRKLCIISFFGRKQEFDCSNLMVEGYDHYENAIFSKTLELLLQDTYELVNLGIIDTDNTVIFNRYSIMPAKFVLTPLGEVHFDLMCLQDIPIVELQQVYKNFQYNDQFGLSDKGEKNGKLVNA